MFARLNRRYDRIKEPWRFLTAIALTMPFVVLIGVSSPVCQAIGLIGLISVIGFRMVA